MDEEMVELVELWVPCKPREATAFFWSDKKSLKLVAKLINGHPIWLAENVYAEKHHLTETEAKHLTPPKEGVEN